MTKKTETKKKCLSNLDSGKRQMYDAIQDGIMRLKLDIHKGDELRTRLSELELDVKDYLEENVSHLEKIKAYVELHPILNPDWKVDTDTDGTFVLVASEVDETRKTGPILDPWNNTITDQNIIVETINKDTDSLGSDTLHLFFCVYKEKGGLPCGFFIRHTSEKEVMDHIKKK